MIINIRWFRVIFCWCCCWMYEKRCAWLSAGKSASAMRARLISIVQSAVGVGGSSFVVIGSVSVVGDCCTSSTYGSSTLASSLPAAMRSARSFRRSSRNFHTPSMEYVTVAAIPATYSIQMHTTNTRKPTDRSRKKKERLNECNGLKYCILLNKENFTQCVTSNTFNANVNSAFIFLH